VVALAKGAGRMTTRGITIGKFYPPHQGHKHLIETGRKQVDEMTVLVCHKPSQKISGELRARWIEEMAPGVRAIIVDDVVPDDDSKGWADYTKRILGYVPDVVFTSEDYGERYARFLGCRHVLVDRDRLEVRVSATQIRQDPLGHWEYLDPCVRSFFARRVCIVGAESTGKTTLAQKLAARFQTSWVPEFGRTYSEAKLSARGGLEWNSSEFSFIASEQNRLEDELAKTCNRLLICDTDSFATSIWHERYIGKPSAAVDRLGQGRNYDLYLLTSPDVPFVQDGTRDGEKIREWMHRRFIDELQTRSKPYQLLKGPYEEREIQAIEACQAVLARSGKL
jgi:NadR type nicotinamide-nucleotide adenylyltransferase